MAYYLAYYNSLKENEMDQWTDEQLKFFEENSIDKMQDIGQFRQRRRLIENFLHYAKVNRDVKKKKNSESLANVIADTTPEEIMRWTTVAQTRCHVFTRM